MAEEGRDKRQKLQVFPLPESKLEKEEEKSEKKEKEEKERQRIKEGEDLVSNGCGGRLGGRRLKRGVHPLKKNPTPTPTPTRNPNPRNS